MTTTIKRNQLEEDVFNGNTLVIFEDLFHEDKTINLPKSILSSTKIENLTNQSKTSELSINCDSDSGNSSNALSPTVEQLSVKTATLLSIPSSSEKSANNSRLNKLRKRQLEVEEEKLQELKKMRRSMEESNRLQNEKLDLLRQLLLPRSDNTEHQ